MSPDNIMVGEWIFAGGSVLSFATALTIAVYGTTPAKPKPKIRWVKLLIDPPCPVCGHGIWVHKDDNYGYNYVEPGGCYKTPPKEVVKSYDGALLTERDVEICDCRVRPHEIRTHYRLARRQQKSRGSGRGAGSGGYYGPKARPGYKD